MNWIKLARPALALAALTLALAGCGAQPAARTDLNVFAAASLGDAFGELGRLFESTHPGVSVVFNFAGSQQLAQQIIAGAPADVFVSAGTEPVEAVRLAGGIAPAAGETFARNRLVVVLPGDNPGKLDALPDLAAPGLKLVLAAKEVPAGRYSLEFLDRASADSRFGAAFKDQVLANVVSYEDNVKAVLAKVALGEADAGIVYASDLFGTEPEQVGRMEIPGDLNVIASYPIAPLEDSRQPELAQAFIDLALSPEGQAILAKFGFSPLE